MSFGKDLLKLLGVVAPSIATAAGGPMAGLATHTLSKMLLGKEDATDDELTEFILSHQNPEVLAKIKAAEIEFQTTVKKLEVDLAELEFKKERMHVDDRVSARAMATTTKAVAQGVISAAVIGGFVFLVGSLFLFEPPESSRTILTLLIGGLATSLTQVMNFWFGSSSGSKVKESQIGEFLALANDVRGKMADAAAKPTVDVETAIVADAHLGAGGRHGR